MEYCKGLLKTEQNVNENVLLKTDSIEELLTNNVNKLQPKQINASVQSQSDVNEEDKCNVKCNILPKYQICGIRQDGHGYRVRIFESKCELANHNCGANSTFIQTDIFICENAFGVLNNSTNISNIDIMNNSINVSNADINKSKSNNRVKTEKLKNIIVIDNSMLGRVGDVNETIDNFFAATHVLDLPIKEIDEDVETRRMRIRNFGPIKVFKPWITIPKKINVGLFYKPTLSTCYHKCPTKCPDTYAPVCGVPGIKAREPSIMFQNHCYMDVAQCKMFWENKSVTAITSSYIESSFLFCLGDQLNGLYRFLPLIKTLQHMGRLKKKGRFRYKLRNMKFLNDLAIKEPKLMG